jgi:hypothetical protein
LEAAARAAVLRFAVVFVAARFAAVVFFGDAFFARLTVLRLTDFFDPAFAVERLTAFFLDARLATPCLLIRRSAIHFRQAMVAQVNARVAPGTGQRDREDSSAGKHAIKNDQGMVFTLHSART